MSEHIGEGKISSYKHIPVTEKRWKELHSMKQAGQTYDDLLEELIKEHHRHQLAEKARAARDGETEMVNLDEL